MTSPFAFIFLRGSILVIYYYFFFLLWPWFLLHSYELFPTNYSARNIYVRNHCEYSDHAIQVIILSYLWRDQTCKLGFLSSLCCAFCYSLRRLLFYRRKKGEKMDVSLNKLFQILSRVYSSLHIRRFLSQARRTRICAKRETRGGEK